MYEAGRSEEVWVVGVPLRSVHEGPEAVDLDEAEGAQDGVEADGQVEEVQRQQAQAVDVEGGGVHVVRAQLARVRLQHAVLQVARAEVEQDVGQVQEVGEVVQREPHDQRLACNRETSVSPEEREQESLGKRALICCNAMRYSTMKRITQ